MSTYTYQQPDQGSAKIYQFPTPVRKPVADYRASNGTDLSHTVYGNCWYHDAAIEESAEDRPHPLA